MIGSALIFSALVLATNADYIVCPDEGNTFYPHPYTCSKFIECNDGVQAIIDCMAGFSFNPETGWCDFAENVDCVDVEEPTTEPDFGSGEGSGGGGPVGECPALNGEFVDFLVDSEDCTKYYMCDWGTPIEMSCPDGLHFNPTLNVCDYPQDAGCEVPESGNSGEEGSGDIDNGSGDIDGGSGGESGENGNGGNVNEGCSNGKCPADNGEYGVYFPHSSDCEKFCQCDWGVPHVRNCPRGLHFNSWKMVCDWPWDAKCAAKQ